MIPTRNLFIRSIGIPRGQLVFILVLLFVSTGSYAQTPSAVSLPKVDKLLAVEELPDPFLMSSGKRVESSADWAERREEIKAMLLYYQYGHPAAIADLMAQELSSKASSVSGATERQLLMGIGPEKKVSYHLILTVPPGKGPFPGLLCSIAAEQQLLLDWEMELFNEFLICGRLDILSSVPIAPHLLKATTDGQDCADERSL